MPVEDDGADSSGLYRHRKGRQANIRAHQLLYPTVTTVSIFFILSMWERRGALDPNRLFNFFQVMAVVFFAAVLFRLLLRPELEDLHEAERSKVVPLRRGLSFAIAAGAISYLRTLPLYFLCDDYAHLDLVRHPFSVAVWPEFTRGQDGVFYRPLAFVSLFLDYRLWHNWVPGYHLTSVLMHLVSIAGVFCLCSQLALKRRICVAAAVFFAVWPVNVQTVTWTAARFDQLAAAFGIWSVVYAAQFRRTKKSRCYWNAIVLFVLAVLSKENAYVIPVLWLSLEILPQRGKVEGNSLKNRAAIVGGYLAAPALMLLLRLSLLRGIGGYSSDNAPMALHFPFASVFGLLVRAPGETLFGWNWLAMGKQPWIMASVLTAAVFLMLALRPKMSASSRPMIIFSLIWVFTSAAPAHFYFWSPDPGLFVSRTLYFGAMGIAILIAILLDETVSSPRIYQGWAVALAVLLFVGTELNISAWHFAAHESKEWLAALKREQPLPPPNVTYYIIGVPDQNQGVPFFAAGLESAVRRNYSWRGDIHVVTDKSPMIPENAIAINYDGSRQ